jgi:hypothetical protein
LLLAQQPAHLTAVNSERADVVPYASRLVEFTHTMRKKVFSAEEGELCIAALNIRDGILICRDEGSADWNYTCAHGRAAYVSQ